MVAWEAGNLDGGATITDAEIVGAERLLRTVRTISGMTDTTRRVEAVMQRRTKKWRRHNARVQREVKDAVKDFRREKAG